MSGEWADTLKEAAVEAGVEYEGLAQTETQVPEPDVAKDALGNLSIVWDDPGGQKLQCQINRLTMQKDGMYSYCSFRVQSAGGKWSWVMEPGRINWYSMSSKTSLRRELDSRDNRWDWKQRLAQVVIICAQTIRGASKPVDLTEVQSRDETRWLAAPLLEAGEHTVLFAPGGVGKSLLSLALCVQLATATQVIPGVEAPTSPVKVLYLDWETSGEVHHRRMGSIAAGIDAVVPKGMIFYWRMEYALAEAIEDIRTFIINNNIGLVIVDSAGVAADGDINTTDVGTAYIKTVRAIGDVGVLTITHMSHDQMERGKGKTLRPIGSVYFQNGPRSSWGLVGDQDESTETIKHLGLVHVKSNNDALKSPLGFIADFTDKGKVIWKSESIHTNQTIASHTTTNARITNLLTTEGRLTRDAIYDELDDIKQDTISRTLRRMVTASMIGNQGDEFFVLVRGLPDKPAGQPKVTNAAGQPMPLEGSDTGTDSTGGLKPPSVRPISKSKKETSDSPPDTAGQQPTVRIEGDEEIIDMKL